MNWTWEGTLDFGCLPQGVDLEDFTQMAIGGISLFLARTQFEVDSNEWFEAIAARLRASGVEAEAEHTGGGIICVVVTKDKYRLYFGTANETWGADVWYGDEFIDDENISLSLSTDEPDVEKVASTIEAAVSAWRGDDKRIDEAVDIAEQAFWAEIAGRFPECKTGDFDPLDTHRMVEQMKYWARTWVGLNRP